MTAPGTAKPSLVGSRDELTGQVYFPPRTFAADGSLRECTPVTLSRTGTLATWTSFARQYYGQIDLPDGVRVQARLSGDDHAIGASYTVDIDDQGDGVVTFGFHRE